MAAFVGVLSVFGAVRWASVEVHQGGSFLVAPAEAPTEFGSYVALFVRDGRSKTFGDTIAAVLHGDSEPGPLEPEVTRTLRPRPGETSSDMDASLAAAWVAANSSIGVDVPFTSRLVIGDQQPSHAAGPDLSEFGVSPGDPVRWSDGDLEVVTDDAVVVVPEGVAVDLVEALDVPLGQPRLTVPAGVRGRSAGLLHGLVYVDHLTAGDLTGGLTVAATGVLGPEGLVTQIGGAVYKAEAAIAAGADVLFVPPFPDEQEEASVRAAVAGRLVVVEAGSLRSALSWLCAHGGVASGVC